jgi:hypothetical protein
MRPRARQSSVAILPSCYEGAEAADIAGDGKSPSFKHAAGGSTRVDFGEDAIAEGTNLLFHLCGKESSS